MIRPSNCVDAIRDKLVNLFVDWSAGLVDTGKPFFVDGDDDYDVVDVKAFMSVDYIAANAVTVSVGRTAGPSGAVDAVKFVNAQSLGAVLVSAGAAKDVTQTATKKLPKGHGLTVTCAAVAGQTGEGVLQVRLRPHDRSRGSVSKRPSAAQSPT